MNKKGLRSSYLLGAGGTGGCGGGARWCGGAQPVFIMANIAKSNTTITNNKPVTFVFMAAVVFILQQPGGCVVLSC